MKRIFTILCLLFSLTSFGQIIPYGLRLDKVQNEIIQKTSLFDSLVLVDDASYWDDDAKIKGFGFKGNEIYKVTIIFKKDTTSFYDITIEHIKKTKLTLASKLDANKITNYSSIEILSSDSLNLKSRTNSYMSISDQPEWTILIIKKDNLILKQSYAPETYQILAPTKERELFMTVFITLNTLLNN
jgi:hypothetical protein